MGQDLMGKGPFTKVNGNVTDAGLYGHVFDGTDDAHDERLKSERVLQAVKTEMQKRAFVKESLESTAKMLTEDF
jgi:hypothetical protein